MSPAIKNLAIDFLNADAALRSCDRMRNNIVLRRSQLERELAARLWELSMGEQSTAPTAIAINGVVLTPNLDEDPRPGDERVFVFRLADEADATPPEPCAVDAAGTYVGEARP